MNCPNITPYHHHQNLELGKFLFPRAVTAAPDLGREICISRRERYGSWRFSGYWKVARRLYWKVWLLNISEFPYIFQPGPPPSRCWPSHSTGCSECSPEVDCVHDSTLNTRTVLSVPGVLRKMTDPRMFIISHSCPKFVAMWFFLFVSLNFNDLPQSHKVLN